MLTLLALATGCAVDYGKVRWLYVDHSLGNEDGEWWYTLNRAADMWGDAIGVPGRLRFTTDRKATPHTVRAMTMDECEDPLSGPGTYIISIEGNKICSGKGFFNPTTNTWTIGLVLEMFSDENQIKYGFTYYNRLGLAAHELGHALWCNHVSAPYAVMYYQMESRATLESTTITYDDLIEYYEAQKLMFPMPSDDP